MVQRWRWQWWRWRRWQRKVGRREGEQWRREETLYVDPIGAPTPQTERGKLTHCLHSPTDAELSCKIENVGCVACLATIRNRVSQVLADDVDLQLSADVQLLSSDDVGTSYDEDRAAKMSRARIRIFAKEKEEGEADGGELRSNVESKLSLALDEIGFPTEFE